MPNVKPRRPVNALRDARRRWAAQCTSSLPAENADRELYSICRPFVRMFGDVTRVAKHYCKATISQQQRPPSGQNSDKTGLRLPR